MKAEINFKNICAYIQGNIREKFFYSKWFGWMIRTHIREQILLRLEHMDPVCFDNGSCKLCGCETPGLQMADKACDKPCYPTMLNKKDWNRFKQDGVLYDGEAGVIWAYKDGELTNNRKKLQDHVERNDNFIRPSARKPKNQPQIPVKGYRRKH